jgi:hypothetical protein
LDQSERVLAVSTAVVQNADLPADAFRFHTEVIRVILRKKANCVPKSQQKLRREISEVNGAKRSQALNSRHQSDIR